MKQVVSAQSPELMYDFAKNAKDNGFDIIIAGTEWSSSSSNDS